MGNLATALGIIDKIVDFFVYLWLKLAPGWFDNVLAGFRWLLDFKWTHNLSVTTGRVFFMVFFLMILALGVSMKRSYVYEGAESQHIWRDLRLWVVVVMAIQIGLYIYF